MMEPGVLVDTFGELQELNQIAGAQIELLLLAAKEKAALGRELTFRVLAGVPPSLGMARRDLQEHGGRVTTDVPEKGLAWRQVFLIYLRHVHPAHTTELFERVVRGLPNDDERFHVAQRLGRDQVRMHADLQNSGQLFRQRY